jgi:hypothetical protein
VISNGDHAEAFGRQVPKELVRQPLSIAVNRMQLQIYRLLHILPRMYCLTLPLPAGESFAARRNSARLRLAGSYWQLLEASGTIN